VEGGDLMDAGSIQVWESNWRLADLISGGTHFSAGVRTGSKVLSYIGF
jgi:hypothetical protein